MKRHIGLAWALMLGLAACGGSGGAARTITRTVTAATSTSSSSQTTTATSAPASSSTTTTTTSTAAGRTQPCTAHDLALSFIGQQGAAGHGELGFALKNISSAPCHTFGYPGIQFLDRHGADLTTIPHHTTSDYFGHAPEVELTVAPGSSVSFRLGVTHGAVPGSVCSTAYGLQVIPPDDVSSIRTQIAGGAYECRDATVSPLQSGESAYR
jgi:Protein of unknown function (DUF4232)